MSHARCALADGHVLLIRELVFFREGVRPVDRVARHGQQNGILVDEASESPGHDSECFASALLVPTKFLLLLG